MSEGDGVGEEQSLSLFDRSVDLPVGVAETDPRFDPLELGQRIAERKVPAEDPFVVELVPGGEVVPPAGEAVDAVRVARPLAERNPRDGDVEARQEFVLGFRRYCRGGSSTVVAQNIAQGDEGAAGVPNTGSVEIALCATSRLYSPRYLKRSSSDDAVRVSGFPRSSPCRTGR